MSLLHRLHRWWWQRLLRRQRIPARLWKRLLASVPALASLDRAEAHRLRELASLFLHQKTLVGANGFAVDEQQRALIAAQASLLVLNLGLDWYSGWSEIIIYPEPFIVRHPQRDEAGVVHDESQQLGGEAWGRGPVILAWSEIDPSLQHRRGHNVVLHEFAHKLDLLDGAANGIPPLHAGFKAAEWAEAFTQAYGELARGHHYRGVGIDPYAGSSPAEFFAVMTELFFVDPLHLQRELPRVYEVLRRFYRQDPVRRVSKPRAHP